MSKAIRWKYMLYNVYLSEFLSDVMEVTTPVCLKLKKSDVKRCGLLETIIKIIAKDIIIHHTFKINTGNKTPEMLLKDIAHMVESNILNIMKTDEMPLKML